MFWIIFFSHAFNPIFMGIGILVLREEKKKKNSISPGAVIGMTVSAFAIYLFWMGAHIATGYLFNIEFNFDRLVGVGQGLSYFLPFIIGAGVIINETVIRPLIKIDKYRNANNALVFVLILFAVYTMLVNYMAWWKSV